MVTNQFRAKKIFREILSDSVFELVNISCLSPDQILQKLNVIPNSKTVVLFNDHTWRYNDRVNEIFDHPKLKNITVIITSLGYENQVIDDRKFLISLPIWYWARQKTKFKLLDNPNYGFSSLNNSTAVHRILLGYFLHQKNLLDDMIYSQNNTGPIDADIFQTLLNFECFKNKLPIQAQQDNFSYHESNKLDTSINHLAYYDAYANIVTESDVELVPYESDINLPCVTEKTYKPFTSCQVPVMLAARGHLDYLNKLGFETMMDLYPDNFDNFPVLKKIDVIVDLVSKGKDYIQNFYNTHIKEIEHNHQLTVSDAIEKHIIDEIKKFINAS